MIKFITEQDDKPKCVFGSVGVNQFFIDSEGRLGQKVSSCVYNIIANDEGTPYADCYSAQDCDEIIKILPKVTKIEFK